MRRHKTHLISLKGPEVKQKKTDVDYLQHWWIKIENIAFWRVLIRLAGHINVAVVCQQNEHPLPEDLPPGGAAEPNGATV